MEARGLEPSKDMPDRLWQSFLKVCDLVEANRAEITRLRRLLPSIEQAYADADLYRILVPADLGGAGIDPLQQLDLVERMAFHDASAAWNFAVGSGLGFFSGFMPREQAKTLFTPGGAAGAGSGAPQGKARRVDGGYVIDGRFSWASGIDQARWVYGGCFVIIDGEQELLANGKPRTIIAIAPKAAATIHDCWNVNGLVATNSTEFTLNDLFVPDERILPGTLDVPIHPDPLFRLPMTFFGFALTGVPLGVARRSVEGLKALVSAKKPAGRSSLSENGYALYAVAKAEAMIEAGRTQIRHAFAAMWDTVQQDETCSLASRAAVRRATAHAAESSLDAANLCYRAAGGSALFDDAPFEAAVRDINAMCGHLVFQRSMMEDAGRVALGQNPVLPVF